MPTRNAHLFGKYLRYANAPKKKAFGRTNFTQILSKKVKGQMPSAGSQMGLWGEDDYHVWTKMNIVRLDWTTRYNMNPRPNTFKQDWRSDALNTTVRNLKVTTSAMYAIDDAGGFDNYIMRTSPEELRSATGEKMRDVALFYQDNPQLRSWQVPWKTFLRSKQRSDPEFSRYVHEARREHYEKARLKAHVRFSPYYLPDDANIDSVARQEFLPAVPPPPELNKWWKATPELEAAFRKRLSEARQLDQKYVSHRSPGAYRKGFGMGRGGWNSLHIRKVNQTYKRRWHRAF